MNSDRATIGRLRNRGRHYCMYSNQGFYCIMLKYMQKQCRIYKIAVNSCYALSCKGIYYCEKSRNLLDWAPGTPVECAISSAKTMSLLYRSCHAPLSPDPASRQCSASDFCSEKRACSLKGLFKVRCSSDSIGWATDVEKRVAF